MIWSRSTKLGRKVRNLVFHEELFGFLKWKRLKLDIKIVKLRWEKLLTSSGVKVILEPFEEVCEWNYEADVASSSDHCHE